MTRLSQAVGKQFRTTAAGIYVIHNRMTGSKYIGLSLFVHDRLNCHRKSLCKGTHYIRKLQDDWNRFGEDKFDLVVLLYCDSNSSILNIFEERAFIVLSPPDARWPEYNSRPAGNSHSEHVRGTTRLENITVQRRKQVIGLVHQTYWDLWKKRRAEGYCESFLSAEVQHDPKNIAGNRQTI